MAPRSVMRLARADRFGQKRLMPPDRIIDLYERTAEAWDAARRALTPLERPHIDAFADALPPGASVLDIGCGTGVPVAEALLARGLAITGIDSAPSLLALFHARFPGSDCRVADMRTLDLGRRFDGLIAWHSFFHLAPEDQRAMFPVFARHAAPAAVLTFTSGPRAGVRMGEWQGEPLYHASLSQAEYRARLAAAGFEVIRFTAGEPLADGPSVWLARYAG